MTNSELKTKLSRSLEYLESELAQVRTGRATPSVLENITVEAYGTPMTLREVGSITAQDAQTLLVSPWDKTLLNEVAKAIRESDLNVNPVVAGESVRVPVPSLTEERRQEFAKLVSTKVEECKTSMRNIRQEAMKEIDKTFLSKDISEDDKFVQREKVEETLKDFITQVDGFGSKKKSDVLTL